MRKVAYLLPQTSDQHRKTTSFSSLYNSYFDRDVHCICAQQNIKPANMDLHYEYDDNATDYLNYLTSELNLTEPREERLSGIHIFLIVTYSSVFFFGTGGNLLVIYIMAMKRQKRRLVDVFITNLACADLFFLVTLPFWTHSISMRGHWPFGNFLCKFTSYVISVNMVSSIFFLTCMSVDRFLAIVLALDSRRVRTNRNAYLSALAVWLISLAFGLHNFVSQGVNARGDCRPIASRSRTVFTLTARVMAFLVPLLIIAFCYLAVAVKLHRHFQLMAKAERKRRSLRVGLWILAFFVTAWLPFNSLSTVLALQEAGYLHLSAEANGATAKGMAFSTCLAFSNSCVNPFIYFTMDGYMQREALRLLPSGMAKIAAVRRASTSTSLSHPERDSALSKDTEIRFGEIVHAL